MGFGDSIQKQEEKSSYEIKTEQVNQEPVHQEAGPQTQENLQVNAPQLVDTQIEENMQLVAQAQATMEQTHAIETAQGGPVLEQIPQNEKFFQRRKRRKLQTKLAKRLSGNATADYVGYNLHQAQVLKKTMTDNSKRLLGIPADADQYLSKFFLKGCQLNKDGKPATPRDEANLKADRKLWEAFSSGDVMARKPYLDNLIADVLKVDLTMDKLKPAYLEHHGMEVLRQSQLLTEAEKVLFSDPVNKQYSCELPDTVLIRIRNVLRVNRMLKMDKLAQQTFEKHGVKEDGSGTWSDAWTKEKESSYKDAIKKMKESRTHPDLPIPIKALSKEELKLRRQKQAELARKESESLLANHMSYLTHTGYVLENGKTHKMDKDPDIRYIQGLFKQYEMDETGKPVSLMDQAILEYNQTVKREINSGKMEKQKQYLDRYLNELLNIKLSEEWLTDEYLEEHMDEIRHLCTMVTVYSNFDHTGASKEWRSYFDGLPRSVKTRLADILNVGDKLFGAISQRTLDDYLVKWSSAGYIKNINTEEDREVVTGGNVYGDSITPAMEIFKEKAAQLKEYREQPMTLEEEVIKERREMQTEQARQLSGNNTADYAGYHLHQGLEQRRTMTENSKKKLGIPADADAFLSKFFLKGCMLNENGEPASPQDAANLEADRKLWEAFSGGDVMARKPYLDNMIDDVLKVDLSIDKLTPDYLEGHGMEVYRQCELLAEAEKVLLQDEVNWQYVKNISDETFMQLRSILKMNHDGNLQKLVHENFRKHGVNVDSEKLWEDKPWSEEDERQYQELQEAYRRVLVDPQLNVSVSALTEEELAERRQAQKQLVLENAGYTVLLDHNSYIFRESLNKWGAKNSKTLKQYDQKASKIKGAKLSNSEHTRLWETLFRVVNYTEDGKPATALDEAAARYNETLIDDYLSGDFERRKPYVDNYLNELLNLEITSDMFTDEYMEEHSIELWRKIELMANYEYVILKNPGNLAYFESLPESVRNRISKIIDFYGDFSNGNAGDITFAFADYGHLKGLKPAGTYDSNFEGMNDPAEIEKDEELNELMQDYKNTFAMKMERLKKSLSQEGGMLREIRAHRMTIEEEIRKAKK